jgi:hypothetical protein
MAARTKDEEIKPNQLNCSSIEKEGFGSFT